MKKTILLAEDDPAVRRMLCRVLAEEDYFVLPASNSFEAIERLHRGGVDLVLLDSDLPLKTGWEMLQWFRSESPSIPVVILGGQNKKGLLPTDDTLWASMEKPLDLFKLLNTIHDFLDKPKQTAENVQVM